MQLYFYIQMNKKCYNVNPILFPKKSFVVHTDLAAVTNSIQPCIYIYVQNLSIYWHYFSNFCLYSNLQLVYNSICISVKSVHWLTLILSSNSCRLSIACWSFTCSSKSFPPEITRKFWWPKDVSKKLNATYYKSK